MKINDFLHSEKSFIYVIALNDNGKIITKIVNDFQHIPLIISKATKELS